MYHSGLSTAVYAQSSHHMKCSSLTFTHQPKKQMINASWYSERLIMLLWALRHVPELPAADQQCDTAIFQNHLPPFESTVTDFIRTAKLHPEADLWDMANHCLNLHWEARDAMLARRATTKQVDIEIIQVACIRFRGHQV